MTDTASLQIRVSSNEVDKADKSLDRLTTTSKKTESATDSLTGAFKKMAGPILAVVSATEALNKLVDVQRQFDVLNAGLITATKSSENAAVAFEALQDFATKTPYDLAQAVDGFNKLVNLGLTPSEKALMSYGNTASAMGKDLNQMIEAVADAATGEFERLKEFGIKAKNNGDTIAFTFQGVTESVKNNAADIETYLMKLGEVNFAGAMEQRMNSLDGAFSNLGDAWDMLFLNISKSGVGDLIEEQVRAAGDALGELNDMFASGQMDAYLDASAIAWQGWADDITASIDIVSGWLSDAFSAWEENSASTGKGMYLGFKEFPAEVRAYFQEAALEVTAHLANMAAQAQHFKDTIAAIFTDDTWDEATKRYDLQMQANNEAYQSSLENIRSERDETINATNAQIDAGKKLREEWEAQRAARAKLAEDRLAQFKVGASGGSGASAGVDKAAAAAAKKQKTEFDNLVASLRTEEEAIQASYDKRKAIIEKNTAEGSALREDLMKRLEKDRADDLQKYQESRDKEFNALKTSLLGEEQALNESYAKRLDIILKNTEAGSAAQAELKKKLDEQYAEEQMGDFATPDTYQEQIDKINEDYELRRQAIMDNVRMTEEQRTTLEEQLTKQRNQRLQILEQQRTSQILQGGAQLFDGLAGMAEAFGGKQNAVYKVMFAASKAFAIADSIIKIQQGIANAAALPWPANLGAIASTVAATSSILANIQSVSYAGAYDEGGKIPAGQFGIVGEYGPEIVNGPATVTGRRQTAQELYDAGSGGGGGLTIITNNYITMQDGGVVDGDTETRLTAVLQQASDKTQSDILTSIRENGMWAQVIGG